MKHSRSNKISVDKKIVNKSKSAIEVNSKNDFFEKNSKIIIWVVTGLSFLFSLLLFNPDVSVGGDDSTYIQSAYNLSQGTNFPTWQGPFYSLFLSFFVKIFGVNIILLKILSVLFFTFSIYFTYKLFTKYGNYFCGTIACIISSVCFTLLTYASTTYSEPIFMFMQVTYLYALFYFLDFQKSMIDANELNKNMILKKSLLYIVLISLYCYVIYQTRTLAIILIPLTILLFIVEKRFRTAGVFTLTTGFVYLLDSLYRKIVWNYDSVSFKGQLDSILMVNPYKPELGYEKFSGFFQRIIDNSQLYFSKHIMHMIGFKNYDERTVSVFATVIIVLLIILMGVYVWKKSRKMLYIYGYFFSMILVTFVMLQKLWDQERLIMIYLPLMLGVFFYCLYNCFDKKIFTKISKWLAVIIIITTISQTFKQGNFDLSDNFDSGKYASYTDDWQNYMLASKWVGENISEDSRVICRKPQMSWMASAGKNMFVGINKLYSKDADSMKNYLIDSLKATHFILANLRLNPYVKDGRTITTVKYSLMALTSKYPFMVKYLKTFGKSEPAFVFQVDTSQIPNYTNLDCAILINPQNVYAWQLKCIHYLDIKKYDIAEKFIEEGLNYNKDNGYLLVLKGVLYLDYGKNQEALKYFDQSLETLPNNPDAFVNKAIALMNLGRKPEALETMAKARSLGVQGVEYDELENRIRNSK
ncbi:MAG: tetratricopeptide repeat protein [Bacteroidales bacterium]|nr:tetratricopeptide repeat protein [Bacteroidales bacterium]